MVLRLDDWEKPDKEGEEKIDRSCNNKLKIFLKTKYDSVMSYLNEKKFYPEFCTRSSTIDETKFDVDEEKMKEFVCDVLSGYLCGTHDQILRKDIACLKSKT